MNSSYSADEIIDAFCRFDGTYRRAHVDAALAMREEITPRLIELLELVRRKPDFFAEDVGFTGHTYATMLLAYFRDQRAHAVIVDLFSLRSDLVDALWGDMTTENLPTLLYRTCGGDLAQIKALAANRSADDYCRSSALTALAHAVADGAADRAEIVAFFGALIEQRAAADDAAFLDLLVGTVVDLCPAEILNDIKRAYDEDRIDATMIDYKEVEDLVKQGPEAGLNRLRQEMQRHMPDDFHGAMDWWAMFREQPAGRPNSMAATMAPSVQWLAQGTQNAKDLNRQQRRKLERGVAKKAKKQKSKRR
jgi:hypothetical protein